MPHSSPDSVSRFLGAKVADGAPQYQFAVHQTGDPRINGAFRARIASAYLTGFTNDAIWTRPESGTPCE
jgi:hypothetical protein